MNKRPGRISSWEGLLGTTSDVWHNSSKSGCFFFPFFEVFQIKSCNVTVLPWIYQFCCSVLEGFRYFFDFGSYRARMQRRGHGCSAKGTWAGRTREPASLGRRKQKKSNRFAICFFLVVFVFLNLVRRYLTFVATALSNVGRDGVV